MRNRKLIKLIKKYNILFVIFFVISVVMLVTLNNVLAVFNGINNTYSVYSKDAVQINVTKDSKDINLEEFLNYFSKKDECMVNGDINKLFNDKFSISALYKGKNSKNEFPLAFGEEFSIENYKNKDKVAILKDYVYDSLTSDNLVEKKDGKEYINYNGKLYEIIGIIDGSKAKESRDIYLNFYSLVEDNSTIFEYQYIYDNGENTRQDIKGLSLLSEQTQFSIVDLPRGMTALNDSLNINRTYVLSAVLLMIVCIITTINISGYWFNREKKELGIIKLLGGTNGNLIKVLFSRYIVISSFAILFGFALFEIIKHINILKGFSLFKTSIFFDLLSIVVLAIVLFLFVIIALIKPIINVNKMQINSVIKGEE